MPKHFCNIVAAIGKNFLLLQKITNNNLGKTKLT